MSSKSSPNSFITTTSEERVEVIAYPGSGKTHTLIERVHHLRTTGVPAQSILALSFSNASVRELRQRVGLSSARVNAQSPNGKPGVRRVSYPASDLSKVTVKTAHAFALGLIGNRDVLTDKKAQTLLVQAIRATRRACRRRLLWADVSRAIRQRRLKQLDLLLEPKRVPLVLAALAVARASKTKISAVAARAQFEELQLYVEVLPAVRNQFSLTKKKLRVIDYGDMLAQAIRKIEGGAPMPFTHILVDEYQDCSPAQAHLVATLARVHGRSVMVFGDPYQAIFGFMGATYTPLSHVLDGVNEFSLPVSRRLTAQTAALASAVAQHSASQAIKTSRVGELPIFVHDKSLDAQVKNVVQHIQTLIAGGTSPEQIAVLARINALLTPIEQGLLGKNVQTNRNGTNRHRKHVLRVLKLVRVIEQCEMANTLITPERLRSVLFRVTEADDGVWKKEALALNKAARLRSLEGRYRLCAAAYLRLMGGVRKDPELRADVNRWEPWCRSYESALTMRAAIQKMPAKGVVTGTIHSAKGGEWDHVLIVGATDGLLPLYLARDDQSLSEERNLMYVAITRARETVRLYHAPTNHARSRKRFEDISRFLDESAVRETLLVA